MNFLALDTSEQNCTVALYANSSSFHQKQNSPKQHTLVIWPMINSLLNQAKISIKDINYIICGHGPGSFTGIRVACSVAQGIASANQISIIPVNSLECLAHQAFAGSKQTTAWPIMDARMQGVYSAIYTIKNESMLESKPSAALDYQTAIKQMPADFIAIGSGWNLPEFKQLLTAQPIDTAPLTAQSLLQLGMKKIKDALPAEKFAPLYLRNPV